MSQTKCFKFVFCHKGSCGRRDLVLLDHELSKEREVLSKCSPLKKRSFHHVLGSLPVVKDEREWANDKKTGEGETKKMANSLPCVLLRRVKQEF